MYYLMENFLLFLQPRGFSNFTVSLMGASKLLYEKCVCVCVHMHQINILQEYYGNYVTLDLTYHLQCLEGKQRGPVPMDGCLDGPR